MNTKKIVLEAFLKTLENKDYLTPAGKALLTGTIQSITQMLSAPTMDERTANLAKIAIKILNQALKSSNPSKLKAKDLDQLADNLMALGEYSGSFVPPVYNNVSFELTKTLRDLATELASDRYFNYIATGAEHRTTNSIKEGFRFFIADANTSLDIYTRLANSNSDDADRAQILESLTIGLTQDKDDKTQYSARVDAQLSTIPELPSFLFTRAGNNFDKTVLSERAGTKETGLPKMDVYFQPTRYTASILCLLLRLDEQAITTPVSYPKILAQAGCRNLDDALGVWNQFRMQLKKIIDDFSQNIREYENPNRYIDQTNDIVGKKAAGLLKGLIKKHAPKTDPLKIALLKELEAKLKESLPYSDSIGSLFKILCAIESHKAIVDEKGIKAGKCGEILNNLYTEFGALMHDPRFKLLGDYEVMSRVLVVHNKINGTEINHDLLSTPLEAHTLSSSPSCTSTSSSI